MDDIAKKNTVKKKPGISATLTPHNRIDAKTVQQWQEILLSAFYKRERTVMNQEKQQSLSSINRDALTAWMRQGGWSIKSTGSAGELWTNKELGGARIGVPHAPLSPWEKDVVVDRLVAHDPKAQELYRILKNLELPFGGKIRQSRRILSHQILRLVSNRVVPPEK